MSFLKRFLGGQDTGERRNQDQAGSSPASSPGSSASTAPWRSRPVFISSTFRDMHAERDHLRNKVFPELEERLRARRHYLEPIDLRLGVETASLADEQTRELQVLKVCLNEIERSRPFLIVLLGDRYGWVPPAERMAAAAQEVGLSTNTKGKSVTALEIEFGVLKKDPAQRRRSLFYFREPLPYDQMPMELRAVYSDAHSSNPAMQANAVKLTALKERIRTDADLHERVRPYRLGWDSATSSATGMETWGQQVLEELWADLDEETREYVQNAPATPEAQERESLAEFVDLKLRDFRGRQETIEQLLTFARSPASEGVSWGVCVTGGPGAGKSSLFARVLRELAARESARSAAGQPLILAHAAGTTPRSAQVDALLRRWVGELANALGEKSRVTDNTSIDELEKTFAALLHRVANKRRVIVLLDALNQFEPTARAQYLTWLPQPWPANARLIATALPGTEAEALCQRSGIAPIELPPLGQREAEEISRAVWRRYHRECNPDVLGRVLAKRREDGVPAYTNPLWLTLAMEQLNLLDADDFSRAGENLHQLLLEMARELPPDVADLYGAMLTRAEKVFGVAWSRAFACLVTLSRAGWREADLRVLLPGAARHLFPDAPPLEWNPLQFAALRRGLRAQLIQRGSHGRWDFTHAQMRATVQQRYMADPKLCRRLHGVVADHLLDLPEDDPLRESETMFHLIGADDRPRAARFFAQVGTQSEATRTLVLHVLSASGAERNPGLEWTISLLDQRELDPETTGNLCHRFQFDLNDALANEARLGIRLRVLEATRRVLDHLAASDPTNAGWQRDLSVSHVEIGDVLQAKGDLAGALTAYRASMGIRERLAASDPTNAGWQRDLSVSHEKIGDVFRAQGDLAGALTAYRASMGIRERLAVSDPTNARWQRDLSISHNNIGDVLLAQGDLAKALTAYRADMRITEQLAASDPTNAEWQRDLSISHNNIGDVLLAQGDLAGALTAYRASMGIRERLAASDPTNAEWQRDLSISHNNIGDVLRAQGDLAGALTAYRASMGIRERLAASDPTNAGWQRDLSISHNNIGDVFRAQGDLAGALTAYRASMGIRERLAASDPTNAGWQQDLSISHNNIGKVLLAQGDLARALTAYRASMGIRERLTALDPTNAEWQRDLSTSHEKIGDVLLAQGDLAGALTAYRADVGITERLAASDPTNAGWQRDLSVSYVKIAGAMKRHGDARANEYWQRAYAILSSIKQAGMFVSPSDERVLELLRQMVGR